MKYRKHILIIITCVLLALTLFLLLHRCLLGRWELCVFRALTGYPCPGCGLIHAAMAIILEGDFVKSFHYHPFLIPLLLTNAWLFGMFFGWFPLRFTWKHIVFLAVLFGAIFAFYAYRMLTQFPSDDYPMVYNKVNYLILLMHYFQR